MRIIKCEWQYRDEGKEIYHVFFNILSWKIMPREFIDRNIFYAGYEKSEIRKENTKRLWPRNSSHADSIFNNIDGLRLVYTFLQLSSVENQHCQNKWNASTSRIG